jgi:hypothetical protein
MYFYNISQGNYGMSNVSIFYKGKNHFHRFHVVFWTILHSKYKQVLTYSMISWLATNNPSYNQLYGPFDVVMSCKQSIMK